MEIMVNVNKLANTDFGRIIQIGAVGFDFGKYMEPHELLQRDLLVFDQVLDTDYGNPGCYVAVTDIDNEVFAKWRSPERREAADAISLCKRRGLPQEVFSSFNTWVKRNLGHRAHIWAAHIDEVRAIEWGMLRMGMLPSWKPEQAAPVTALKALATRDDEISIVIPDITKAGLIPRYALHEAAGMASLAQASIRNIDAIARRRSPIRAKGAILLADTPVVPANVNEEKQP